MTSISSKETTLKIINAARFLAAALALALLISALPAYAETPRDEDLLFSTNPVTAPPSRLDKELQARRLWSLYNFGELPKGEKTDLLICGFFAASDGFGGTFAVTKSRLYVIEDESPHAVKSFGRRVQTESKEKIPLGGAGVKTALVVLVLGLLLAGVCVFIDSRLDIRSEGYWKKRNRLEAASICAALLFMFIFLFSSVSSAIDVSDQRTEYKNKAMAEYLEGRARFSADADEAGARAMLEYYDAKQKEAE